MGVVLYSRTCIRDFENRRSVSRKDVAIVGLDPAIHEIPPGKFLVVKALCWRQHL
jgi:hypothetical protein